MNPNEEVRGKRLTGDGEDEEILDFSDACLNDLSVEEGAPARIRAQCRPHWSGGSRIFEELACSADRVASREVGRSLTDKGLALEFACLQDACITSGTIPLYPPKIPGAHLRAHASRAKALRRARPCFRHARRMRARISRTSAMAAWKRSSNSSNAKQDSGGQDRFFPLVEKDLSVHPTQTQDSAASDLNHSDQGFNSKRGPS